MHVLVDKRFVGLNTILQVFAVLVICRRDRYVVLHNELML